MKYCATPSWLKCVLIAGLWAISSVASKAQKAQEFDRIIEFASAFTEAQSKFIHEGVRDQDPGALIWVDVPAQQVLLRAHVVIDRMQLQAVVGAGGLVITYLGPPRIEAGALKSAGTMSRAEAPVYRNTGDPALDNARYEFEKKAWIEAYPERYLQQLQTPVEEH